MRLALTAGRFTVRQALRRPRTAHLHTLLHSSKGHSGYGGRKAFRGLPKGRNLVFSAVGLSPAVFVTLSEKENEGPEDTAEGRMLVASREEIEKKLSDDDRGLMRVGHAVILFLDLYIWEPFCTATRFLSLVFIFVPVILTVPVIWLGRRDKTRDNERSGTLWWYGFMIQSMERAGPAFIKVS